MDPITITTSAIATTRICLGSAKRLYDIVDKYRHASKTIAAIYSESVVIGASLRQLQNIICQNEEVYLQQFRAQPDLSDVFEAALLGCSLVYSCLDDEVQRLKGETNDAGETNRRARARFLWKEETMKDLLQSIRAQNAAITLLLQCLQVETVSSMQKTLENVREMVAGINDLVVNSAQDRPGVAEALLEDVLTPMLAHNPVANPDVAEDDASILGLAPSTKFQSPRHSILSNVSDSSFQALASNNRTGSPSLTSDLFRRLSQRIADPSQLVEAPPVPEILSTIASNAQRSPSASIPLPNTQEHESDFSIDEDATDEGYESHFDAPDTASIITVNPPVGSAPTVLDIAPQQNQNSLKSTPRRDLKDEKSEPETLGADATILSDLAEYPPSRTQDDCGVMKIEQAVDRFMCRLSLAASIPGGISDIQLQGRERQPAGLLPIKASNGQSHPSSRELEQMANPTSPVELDVEMMTAGHAIYDHLDRSSSSASSQQDTVYTDESDEEISLPPNDMNEAIDRVLRTSSHTHLRIASASRKIATPLKPNTPITVSL